MLLNAIFAADNIKTGSSMVKQYQRKRTKEELISGFKQAIAKKKEWLEAHHLEELKVAEA